MAFCFFGQLAGQEGLLKYVAKQNCASWVGAPRGSREADAAGRVPLGAMAELSGPLAERAAILIPCLISSALYVALQFIWTGCMLCSERAASVAMVRYAPVAPDTHSTQPRGKRQSITS